MKTYLDCLPCFLKQALAMGRLVTGDETVHKQMMDEVARMIPEFSLVLTPPEMSRLIHRSMRQRMGERDFYRQIKQQSNQMALALYPRLKEMVAGSTDPLRTAVEVAIAGNVIDYGAKNSLDIDAELAALLDPAQDRGDQSVFHFAAFREALDEARTILYLADNAGEVVFDRVLIEQLPVDKEIIYAVRDQPVINDALIEDARACGIDRLARVISSGVDAPGTVLKYCSPDFRRIFSQVDMVISKGQGNYEALGEDPRTIFFLLRAKCPIIARHAGVPVGAMILLKGERRHDAHPSCV